MEIEHPIIKSFIFTEESLQDLIMVLGPEDGLEAFLKLVEIEATSYLLTTGPRWSETERQYLLKKMGYR